MKERFSNSSQNYMIRNLSPISNPGSAWVNPIYTYYLQKNCSTINCHGQQLYASKKQPFEGNLNNSIICVDRIIKKFLSINFVMFSRLDFFANRTTSDLITLRPNHRLF